MALLIGLGGLQGGNLGLSVSAPKFFSPASPLVPDHRAALLALIPAGLVHALRLCSIQVASRARLLVFAIPLEF